MRNSKETGSRSERLACEFLQAQGYKILHRNYFTPYGEADIIAIEGDTTVFVEVKSADNQDPIESVHEGKVRKIRNVALHYMQRLEREIKVRFDVITIVNGQHIRHLKDAF